MGMSAFKNSKKRVSYVQYLNSKRVLAINSLHVT